MQAVKREMREEYEITETEFLKQMNLNADYRVVKIEQYGKADGAKNVTKYLRLTLKMDMTKSE